jgi:D-3-phosphoglycerate dehydrogenase
VKSILQEQMEGVNYVNAPVVAKSRAIKIKETKMEEGGDFASLLVITVKGDAGENTVQGTLLGKKEPRLIKVNNIYLEADLRGHILFVYNYDKPGVIASIANVFFIRDINIGGMHFGRESIGGLAISLLDLDKEAEDNVIREIQSLPNIVTVKKIELS